MQVAQYHQHTAYTNANKILFACPNKQSDSDLIPTWLLKKVLLFSSL